MKILVVFTAFILAISVTAVNGAQCIGRLKEGVRRTERRKEPSSNSYLYGYAYKSDELVITDLKKGGDDKLWYQVGHYYVEAAYIRITQENGKSWCKLGQGQTPLLETTTRPRATPEQRQAALRWLSQLSGLFRY